MADQQETSQEQTAESHREYLARALSITENAHDVVALERSSLLQALAITGNRLNDPSLTPEQSATLSQHLEDLMEMLGNYTVTLRVLETIGGAALQGLANTGIRVPEAAPILGPDGEVLAKPKARSKRKG